MPPRNGPIVLMTSPSLNRAVNVSGVASVVRGLLEHLNEAELTIVPLVVGKSDGMQRGIGWAVAQLLVPLRFLVAVVSCRPDVIHVNGPLNSLAILRDLVLLVLSRLYTGRVVYHMHGGSYVSSAPNSRALRSLICCLFSVPGFIVVLGEKEAQNLHLSYGVDRERIRVLPNATRVPVALADRDESGPLKILSLGRLSEEKGLKVLCSAFEDDTSLRNVSELRVYGAGPLEGELVERLNSSLGGSFYFGGVAEERERNVALSWADVIVLPSLGGEGLPMALLEAMAVGVVPIVTDDGMMKDVVVHHKTGFLVQKDSAPHLGRTLKAAHEAKANGQLSAMAINSHDLMLRRHSIGSYASTLAELYRSLL